MDNQNKIKTFIGFAIKSRNVKYGVDSILKARKIELIIESTDLTENSKKKLHTKFEDKIPIIVFQPEDFKFFLNQDSIKVIAITDKRLSEAILKQNV